MGLFGSKQETTAKPWKYAKQPILDSMATLGNLPIQQYYPLDQLNAPMRQGLQQSLQGAYGWGQGQGAGLVNSLAGMGNMGSQAMQNQMGYLHDLSENGGPAYQFDQGTFNTTMQNLQPGLQGAFDAQMRDPTRQFNEQILPGINMGSVGSGGQFGTKAFNQGAIANRGLQDRAADVASGLWQNAANQAQQAGYGAGMANLGAQQNTQGQIMGGYNNLANLGLGAYGQANASQLGNLGLGLRAGEYEQALAQGDINRQVEGYLFNQQAPWNAALQRLQAFGGLGSQFGKTSQSQSQGIGSIGAGLLGSYMMGSGSLPSFGGMFGGGGGGGGGFPGSFGGGWNGNSYGYW
jgi:hypothetical protein